MQEQYISSDELFNSIKEDFYKYDSAGLIDEGKFYRHVTYILGLFGNTWYRPMEEFLEVKNFSVKLPDDFNKLDQVYRCHLGPHSNVQPPGVILTKRNFDHFNELCNTNQFCLEVPTDCILNSYEQLIVQRNNIVNTYQGFQLLSIGNKKTRSLCKGDCINLYSDNPDSITIQNKTLFTNFREGHIYFKYLGFPLDEDNGLPLIPNNEKVMKCIEYYIKSKVLENFWVNGDADVAQKIGYFKNEFDKALGDAISESKLPSFNTMVNAIKVQRKRLNVYQLHTRPRITFP